MKRTRKWSFLVWPNDGGVCVEAHVRARQFENVFHDRAQWDILHRKSDLFVLQSSFSILDNEIWRKLFVGGLLSFHIQLFKNLFQSGFVEIDSLNFGGLELLLSLSEGEVFTHDIESS